MSESCCHRCGARVETVAHGPHAGVVVDAMPRSLRVDPAGPDEAIGCRSLLMIRGHLISHELARREEGSGQKLLIVQTVHICRPARRMPELVTAADLARRQEERIGPAADRIGAGGRAVGSLPDEARRLLMWMKTNACGRENARTDERIARETGIGKRNIIELADVLLAAGELVLASTEKPRGRWWIPSTHELADAVEYERVLKQRALKILQRRRHLRHAMAIAESHALIDADGQQRRLPLTAGVGNG